MVYGFMWPGEIANGGETAGVDDPEPASSDHPS